MKSRTRRIRKQRIPEATMIARSILPDGQAHEGAFEAIDIINHSDDDQRRMVRSGSRRTIRRLTKIEKLHRAGILDQREAAACQWYAEAHACRYDTTGVTAAYGETGGAARTNFDHLPKTRQQEDAYRNFDAARAVIPPMVRPMFEAVVLFGRPLGRLSITFRATARKLLDHIEETTGLTA